MKNTQFTILIIGFMILYSLTGFSQSVSFTYDAAGNRLTRSLTILKITNNNTSENNDHFKLSAQTTLSVNEPITINDLLVSISPNPNGGKFEVKIDNFSPNTIVDIYLHSIEGKLVYENNKAKSVNSINISTRENGTYILTVLVNGTKETWKVIKQ